MKTLFELNRELDLDDLARRFQNDGRVQVRDFLTPEAGNTIRELLERQTPWGIAWQAGDEGPHMYNAARLRSLPPADRERVAKLVFDAARKGEYAVRFANYAMLDEYLAKPVRNSPHDLLLEHINAEPFLNFARTVTGMDTLIKADAQATLYAPGDFLSSHNDSHVMEGWKVAYVMNFADADWRPDWGGYLNFLDDDGDIVAGWKPRPNAINLFRVPTQHNVSYVPPFAAARRFAITGWLRDR